MPPTMQIKRGSAAALASVNPTPLAGELVWDTTNNTLRVGNGSTAYSSLAIVSATPTDDSVTTAKLANDAVTYAKIQNVSATDRLLGRSSAGAGDVEEITCTAAGRALLSGADAAAQRSTLSVQPTASPAFTGTVSAAAANFTGAVSITSPLTLTGTVAGNVRQLKLQTSGVDRWQITPGFDAESGSNAGSTFWITRWSDAGVFLGTPIAISRATGSVTLENPLFVQAGSASACGVAFSGDTNTGVFSPSADVFCISTSGSERFRVASNGDAQVGGVNVVGLRYFDVRNTDATLNSGAIMRLITRNAANTTDTSVDLLRYNSGLFAIVNNDNGPIALNTGGTERMRIDASGNVGVGNIVPTHRIDCNGEVRLRGTGASTEAGKLHLYWVSSTNRATWTTDASGNALIETGSSAPAERFRVGVNGRSQFFAASEKYGVQLNNGSTANGPFIGSAGADIFTVSASGGAELLRVDASGNTCIGSAGSSAAELSVFKDKNAGRTAILIDNLDQRLRLSCYYESGVGQYAEIQSATDSESSFQNLLLQRQGGGVLIGTATSNGAYKLQVNSQIYATNATIATSDARFKTNVETLTDATAVIEALRPVAFDFLPHAERNFATERQVGLIAQEAQSALAGTDYADSVVAQCGDHLGLAYEKLVPVLIKALQESNARIAALEERNHA